MAPPDDYRLEAPLVYYVAGPPTPEAKRVSDVILDLRPGALIVVAPRATEPRATEPRATEAEPQD
jgi:hypothetical protein